MPKFTFDMTLTAAITVDARTVEEGRAALERALECADTNFGAFKNGDPILGECSLAQGSLRLGMVDGADYDPPLDEKWIRHAEDHGARFTEPTGKRGDKYWHVFDTNEEAWRVDASDRCKTKADAARAYCDAEGCGEPDGVDPDDIDTRAD